ncbi:MAG: hypothetical protein WC184_05375 [Acidimicrobiia bacterium]
MLEDFETTLSGWRGAFHALSVAGAIWPASWAYAEIGRSQV